ncbi:MAG: prepilin peptidase CpaA [Clostridia bacterium]|nr:prepilin peptidase CpaA [Clostridia bacterium]
MLDLLLLITLAFCLFTDIKYKKIYNKILFPAIIIGISLNVFYYGLIGFIKSIEGFLLGLGLLILPFICGGIGAGDVKLLAAIGAIKGTTFVFYSFIYMGIVGGLISIGILIYQKRLLKVLYELIKGLFIFITSHCLIMPTVNNNPKNKFPYGIAIVIGTLATYGLKVI